MFIVVHPLWECSAVGSAAAVCSSGICPLDTTPVTAGTAWRKCAVLYGHGPAWTRGKQAGPVPGRIQSQC